MVKNVNRTARLQWKVDTIKNCKYLQCRSYIGKQWYAGCRDMTQGYDDLHPFFAIQKM